MKSQGRLQQSNQAPAIVDFYVDKNPPSHINQIAAQVGGTPTEALLTRRDLIKRKAQLDESSYAQARRDFIGLGMIRPQDWLQGLTPSW